MERLDEYRKKRDFDRTAEPAGAQPSAEGRRRYVMHKHAASRLHYDLRLEHEGVLLSWALPKGPSLEPGEKRLAVHVEDHPLEYGDFEGTIPAGEYGGGTVMLWDRGRWEPVGKGVQDDRIDFTLDGEKLQGTWTLTKTGGRAGRDEDDWLLIKRTDADAPPLEPGDESVLTGRTMEQIAEGIEASDVLPSSETVPRSADEAPPEAAELEGARRRAPPEEPEPQLATLTDAAPAGEDWLHEIKFDGYRVLAFKDGATVRLTTRNGHDWTDRFPEIAEVIAPGPGTPRAARRRGRGAGRRRRELLPRAAGGVEQRRDRAPDVPGLRPAPSRRPRPARRRAARRANGRCNVCSRPPGCGAGRAACATPITCRGRGADVFERACAMGLEGIIAKRVEAPYRGGRGRRWLKVKCGHADEFVVGGFTPPQGSRAGLRFAAARSLRGDRTGVRRPRRDGFRRPFAAAAARPSAVTGAVGLAVPARRCPTRRASPGSTPSWWSTWRSPNGPATAGCGTRPSAASARTRTPAEVRAQGGGRDDRGVGGWRWTATPKPKPGPRLRKGEAAVAGVRLTNADRVLYPAQGITKRDLAEYYVDVEEHVLPGLVERPLSLVRCPEGPRQAVLLPEAPRRQLPERVADRADRGEPRARAQLRLRAHDRRPGGSGPGRGARGARVGEPHRPASSGRT